MAGMAIKPLTKHCELCGAEFPLNPKYSKAQRDRARFCSKACTYSAPREDHKEPIAYTLNGKTRFSRLTFIGEGDPYVLATGRHIRRARFLCDCGKTRDIQPTKVLNGANKSCGCLSADKSSKRFTKHGGYQTAEYRSWNAMIQRCTNTNSTSFAIYGGRGITVCERWMGDDGFANFVADMGQRPKGKSLDRINPDDGYYPGNVRWATAREQSNNRRITKLLTVCGETQPLTVWTERMGFGKNTIAERLAKGWSEEDAVLTPRLTAPPT